MGKHKISFSLSESEIDRAIRELEQYKRDFLRKMELLRQKVAKRLADEAKHGFNGAIVDDLSEKSGARLAEVNVSVSECGDLSVVIANGEDAIWVEFGAGVHYNGSVGSSPHPKGQELGFTIGGYGKGKGAQQKWGFYEDGELKITYGTPAKMPMYKAVKTVCDDIASIVREVFG